jgi:hypothetical protein
MKTQAALREPELVSSAQAGQCCRHILCTCVSALCRVKRSGQGRVWRLCVLACNARMHADDLTDSCITYALLGCIVLTVCFALRAHDVHALPSRWHGVRAFDTVPTPGAVAAPWTHAACLCPTQRASHTSWSIACCAAAASAPPCCCCTQEQLRALSSCI